MYANNPAHISIDCLMVYRSTHLSPQAGPVRCAGAFCPSAAALSSAQPHSPDGDQTWTAWMSEEHPGGGGGERGGEEGEGERERGEVEGEGKGEREGDRGGEGEGEGEGARERRWVGQGTVPVYQG